MVTHSRHASSIAKHRWNLTMIKIRFSSVSSFSFPTVTFCCSEAVFWTPFTAVYFGKNVSENKIPEHWPKIAGINQELNSSINFNNSNSKRHQKHRKDDELTNTLITFLPGYCIPHYSTWKVCLKDALGKRSGPYWRRFSVFACGDGHLGLDLWSDSTKRAGQKLIRDFLHLKLHLSILLVH